MAQYQLGTSSFQVGQVGTVYNVGLSDGTKSYGYLFSNQGSQSTGFEEETNVADKEKMIQFSSPNLIDRDLAFYPRVSQGDFSGGALQTVFLDATKYFDSDLEIRTPGYLTLRPGWKRQQITTGLGAITPQSVFWNNDVYTTFQGSSYYNSAGTAFAAAAITAKFIDTDGLGLYVADGVNTLKSTTDNVTYVTIANATGALQQMWVVQLGTAGRFVYFVPGDPRFLYRIDVNAAYPAPPVLVPTGGTNFHPIDVVAYQTGVAILSQDYPNGGCEVWYHDGANMTRIVRLNQFVPGGLCSCLGSLYVTGQSAGQYEGPLLMKISGSAFSIAARISSPSATLTSATIGAPVSSGQYVYFALGNPQLSGVTATSYVGVYDAVTGAYSHMGSQDGTDAPLTTNVRQMSGVGRAAAFPMVVSGTGSLQWQTNNSRLASGNTYSSSGTLVSSSLDFGTPGLPKRFRRIEVVHSPLAAGESIKVNAFVDRDPLSFTTSLAPNPATATITNSTLNSTLTALTFGADTVGRSLYYSLTLMGNGTTTPRVQRSSVEVGGTYTWTFDFDCSSKRRTLQQQTEDQQGVNGKDLYYLLRNAYENGTLLTLYLAQGASYTVTIESLKGKSVAYSDHLQSTVRADQEFLVHAVLKQVA